MWLPLVLFFVRRKRRRDDQDVTGIYNYDVQFLLHAHNYVPSMIQYVVCNEFSNAMAMARSEQAVRCR